MKLFKLKTKDKDFTEANLPHNRREVFATVFKNRLSILTLASLLCFAFLVPLLVWTIYMRFNLRGLEIAYINTQDKDTLFEIFFVSLFKNVVNLPLLFIAGMGIGGLIHIINQLAWNEMVFISDFFHNFKKNFIRYGMFMAVFGLSYMIFGIVYYGNHLTNLNQINLILAYGISILQLVLFSTFIIFMYMQNEVYEVKGKYLISNSFKFMLKSLIPMMVILLIGFLPLFLQLFDTILCDFIMVFLTFIFLPICLLVSCLYINSQFDKFINKESYPSIYRKGIY